MKPCESSKSKEKIKKEYNIKSLYLADPNILLSNTR